MNLIRTSAIAAVLALSAIAANAADGTFDKTLSTSGKDIISVNTGSGYIHISSGSDNQVHIVGHVRANKNFGLFSGASTDADAEAKVREIVAHPPIEQLGDIVKIGDTHNNDLYRNTSIDYDVTLPKNTTLKANSGSGNVQIHSVTGEVTANTGSGDVQVQDIGGGSRLNTGSGSITAESIHGAAYAQTGSGSIHLTVNGAGDVNAHTGSGSIHLEGVNGALKADTGSGSIEAAGNPTQDWRLTAGSGSIHINIGSSAHVTLDADSGSGGIHVDQPITMQSALNRHHVHGTINGGGVNVHLGTGSGDITVR